MIVEVYPHHGSDVEAASGYERSYICGGFDNLKVLCGYPGLE